MSLVLEKYSFATTHPGRSERQSDGRQGRPERTRITGGEIRGVQEGVSGESSPSNRSGARVVQKNTNNNVTKREQRARTHISTLVGIK